MPLTRDKTRCSSCGTKNEAGAERCRICTRSLAQDSAPSQEAYEETLYSQPVRESAIGDGPQHVFVLSVLLLAALVGLNYFYLGFGPDWAHRYLAAPGATWHTVDSDNWRAVLPGTPDERIVETSDGDLKVATVGVDKNWVSTLDATVRAPGDRVSAQENLYATVVVADGAIGQELNQVGGELLGLVLPDMSLDELSFAQVTDPQFGSQIDVKGGFRGGTRPQGSGDIRARLTRIGNNVYIVAAFVESGSDPALFDMLLRNFSPRSELAETDPAQ